mmetsp:Transcript_48584/g.77322  ORF Transcript_48584/g.77322 Transcript_48584/m.77322 type:complete len:307 (-) Transcript_48584:25-945(-)
MQSPRWDQEAVSLRADPRKDYSGFRRTKDVFKQKTQRFCLPNLTDSQMLVLSTTVVYFLTLCLYYFAFFRHAKVVLLFTAASLLSCPAFAMLNGKRRFEVSLAACCGVALLLGAIAGLYSYASFGFFSWKLFTSRTYENVVPSEDPGIVADGGKMSFAKEAYLDQARSVGFAAEDGNLYCAAPISSHSGPKEDVNFWAVGLNCCALSGRFECDAAPKQTGHGLILWDQPQHFHDARRKSAATFGIHGVEDPIFLRWVSREQFLDMQRSYDREAAFFATFTTMLLAAGSSTLAWAFRPKDLAAAIGA